MSENTALAPVEEPKAGLPALYDYGEHADRGFEDERPDETQVPFIALLQSNSPQVTGEGGVEIPGAKAGRFFNTVAGTVIGESFEFIPAAKQHVFVEWKPRTQGGGFVGMRQLDEPVVQKARETSKEFGKYTAENGNNLVDTIYLFGLVKLPGGGYQAACLAFTSTKIKAYKKWNTLVNQFTVAGPDGKRIRPPRYAHVVTVKSVAAKNQKGSFFVLELKPAKGSIAESLLTRDDPLFIEAAKLADAVSTGTAKVAEEATSSGAEDNEAESPF